MTGIDAITANNGWAMAVTGALIVISGLACLSLVISQLHKVIALFEPKMEAEPIRPAPEKPQLPSVDVDILNDPATAARIYRELTSSLGDSFELSELYQLLKKEGLPHPHLTIRSLRESGFLIRNGDTRFKWKEE